MVALTLLWATGGWLPAPSTVFAQTAVAPATAIEVVGAEHENRFPREVVFALEARGLQADIVKATLRFRQAGEATVVTTNVKFEPGREVTLQYTWDLRRYYAPPGVDIAYYWLLEDATGEQTRTPEATFIIEDTRFDWQTTSRDSLELHWYAGDRLFAEELLASGVRALSQLAADAGVDTDLPIKVYVYANQRDLLSALSPAAQDWTGGTAFTTQNVVLVAAEPTASGIAYGLRVIPHEISHVVVHTMTRNPYGGLPRWLDEGLAMYAEGEMDDSHRRGLDDAIRRDSLISVRSLSANFPSDPQAAHLSYAQSYSLVNYLIDQYGSERVRHLLEVFGEGSTYDAALETALGVDTDGLEREWREAIGASPPPEPGSIPAQPEQSSSPGMDTRAVLVTLALACTAILLILRRRR